MNVSASLAHRVDAEYWLQQGDFDNTLMRTVAWQQALMLVLFTGLSIGHKRSLELTQGEI